MQLLMRARNIFSQTIRTLANTCLCDVGGTYNTAAGNPQDAGVQQEHAAARASV